MLRLVLIIVILSSLPLNVAHAQTIRNGEDLLRAMHERYKDSWYQTVTFTQKSTTYKQDGTSTAETWYEAALLPGRLRIDIGPASDGKGYIFSDGNVSVIKDNRVVSSVKSINMLWFLDSTYTARFQKRRSTSSRVKATISPSFAKIRGTGNLLTSRVRRKAISNRSSFG